ncbi:DUF4890 domain-containing protein [Yeosuana marina]|jgi:hypothetical protein|uniref:DUF4890 domain-containing protein n=1 Tax=Yeosuana marina TaxID=1565536 RepID=UPI0030C850EA
MKKLVFIAVAFIAIQATSQNANQRPNKERGNRAEQFSDMTPEEMATLQTKKMTLHLDLNESQQRAVQQLNLQNATERKARMEARKAQRESGNMEKPSKEERLKMMNEVLDHKIAMKAKMKDILNADQYAKWEQSQEKMEGRHKKMAMQNGMKGKQKNNKK